MLLRLVFAGTAALMRLAGARLETTDVAGYRLRVWTLGPVDGEPWLLLHGLAATAASWLPLLPRLRRDCRLVVPELSALGGTTGPGDGLDVTRGFAVAAALIEHQLGGGPATVCGSSLGGWIGVRLALARPDLVGRLFVLSCAGYRHEDWARVERLVRPERTADVDRLVAAQFARRPPFLALARPLLLRAFTSAPVRNVLAALSADDAFDEAELAGLTMPVGILWGAHDGLFPVATGEAMARAIPHAVLEVLAGCAHVPQWEAPRQVSAALARLRRRVPLPQGATIGAAS